MFSWKVLLISVAVVFAALGLKASLPLATTNLPILWTFFLLCFKPPYLYVILNAIIISIVASSRFNHSSAEPNHPPEPTPPPPPVHVIPEPPLLEMKAVLVNGSDAVEEAEDEGDEEEKKVIDEGMTLMRTDSTEIAPEYLYPDEKPLVSARFGHRKPPKASYEGGRALRVVAKVKRHETLENTWKAITEGRSMPLSRHMKKCDTWQSGGNAGPPEATVNKCETFNDGSKTVSASAARLRREPSLSQDELNRRVEAFIHKFNEEMRLQRQQSLEQYMQMINRGAA
ncbi:uncharacterized protein LOC113852707 isoform X2 [Abrus precatorius]|uniref:Uncharacterized protein LOC113852707 isoform X2 n=1 Tax=Abrus precatorius TaxID=3816 RepID=A0A8B8K6H6_ABRPR|nr:uncharacterized protein LOC113852707 isoform X2 [Abrus precatorius]